jgi:hypothetical protein
MTTIINRLLFTIAKKYLLRYQILKSLDKNTQIKQYAFWLSDRKFACSKSLIGQCFKRRPKQISNKEITVLKNRANKSSFKLGLFALFWERQFVMALFLWRNLFGMSMLKN